MTLCCAKLRHEMTMGPAQPRPLTHVLTLKKRIFESFAYILTTSSSAFIKTFFILENVWMSVYWVKIQRSTAAQRYAVQNLVISTASKLIRPLLKIQTEDELLLFEYFIPFQLYSVTI